MSAEFEWDDTMCVEEAYMSECITLNPHRWVIDDTASQGHDNHKRNA